MNPKLILCLTLVVSAGLCGCSTSSGDFHKWQTKAAQVTVGMTREQVEKLLPPWQYPDQSKQFGPPVITAIGTGPGQGVCYWVSEYTQVSLRYDYTGGQDSISNRVRSLPVHVKKWKPSDKSDQSPTPLYLHFFTPTFNGGTNQGRLYLSTQIHLSKEFFAVATNNNASLRGNIKCSQQKLIAHIEGYESGTTGIYDGEVVPDKPFSAQTLCHSGAFYMPYFVLSTNLNCKPFLKAQAVDMFEQAEKSKSKPRVISGDAYQTVRDASRKLDELQISLEALPKIKTNTIVLPSLAFKKVRVEVPTRFKITRTNGVLTVALDANTLEKTNLIAGENMVLGIEARLSVYFQMNSQIVLINGQGFEMRDGTDFDFAPHTFEIPFSKNDTKYKTKYTVEEDLNIFETDIQPQHLWNPQNGKYSVLWQRKLRHTFEE